MPTSSPHRMEIDLDGRTLSIETGKIAKQADGSALVQLENGRNLPALRSSDHVADDHRAFQRAFAPGVAKTRQWELPMPRA